MTRKSIRGLFGRAMIDKADPIIENKSLPLMEAVDAKKTKEQQPLKKGQMLMGDIKPPSDTSLKKAIFSGNAMGPFVKVKPNVNSVKEMPDQVSKVNRTAATDSYVVLRMHVQNGVLSVVGSKQVSGSLTQIEDLVQSGLTYEATLNDERLSIGSIADFGERRSFARPGEEGHHITILPSFNFNVKIPGSKVTLRDLPKLTISLYQFKEHVPDIKLNSQPLRTQFEREVREVAVLKGIKIASLRKDIKELIKKTIRN